MSPVKHWKLKAEDEKTLCGRVRPTKPDVDPTWPLCKQCAVQAEYLPHVVTMTPEQIKAQEDAPAPEGQEDWPRVILTEFRVQRIRGRSHKKSTISETLAGEVYIPDA